MLKVITVARQLGAGGGKVANLLADRLGWRLLDRALVERIAEDLQVAPEQIERHTERVESFIERLGQYLSEGFPEALSLPAQPPVSPELTARAARRVVAAVLEEEPAVVVGHGAQCIFQGDPRALHVFVHAPLALRTERAQERYGVDAQRANDRVRRSDADRRRYIREHFGREWLDPTLYHLCLDTGRLGVEGAVDLIQAAVGQLRNGDGSPAAEEPSG